MARQISKYIGKHSNLELNTSCVPRKLDCFLSAGHAEIVDILLERGADSNAKNEEGETALHKAAINGHDAVAKSLLLKKVNVDAKVDALDNHKHVADNCAIRLQKPLCHLSA